MIRVLIVDDEQVARERLVRLLAAEADIRIVGHSDSGPQAIADIRRLAPDLVLLDVQMPGCDGFEVLRAFSPAELPSVVFVTAFDQYALQAFEVHALDYLLKPFDARRLGEAIARVRERLARDPGEYMERLADLLAELSAERARLADALSHATKRWLERVVVRTDGRRLVIGVDAVDWFESWHNHVRVHAGGEVHLVRRTLSDLETQLDPARFARVHRFSIVNVQRIREVLPAHSGDAVLVLRDGRRLRASRSYRDALTRVLAEDDGIRG